MCIDPNISRKLQRTYFIPSFVNISQMFERLYYGKHKERGDLIRLYIPQLM